MRSVLSYLKRLFSGTFSLSQVRYLRKWFVISVLIGVVAGVGSIVFYLAIHCATWLFLGQGAGFIPPSPGGEGTTVFNEPTRAWLIPVICAAGGLLSGIIVFKFAPEAEGHGTDAAINAFHNKDGFIRRRVPFVKIIASAITIGSGGSAGREGPVALVGAGFGSAIADVFKLNSHDRRIALAVGIGAGIGAIFKAPLGGALLSAEILYRRDFEFEALLPSFIASIVGYSIFGSYAGWSPVFTISTSYSFSHPQDLIGFAILGVICGIFGTLYGRFFYKVRDLFRLLKIPAYVKPAIGGLLVGTIGMFLPQVLGMGYGWLQFGINGNLAVLPLGLIIAVAFGKIVATSLSIGSGGSGGVFAPGLVIGGMVGAAAWILMDRFTGLVPPNPAAFVILGMMTLFGGIAKAPIAIMIMVSEMAGSYDLLVPSMISVTIAYFLTGESYIYENQVQSRVDSPAHRTEFSIPLLERIKVTDAMAPAAQVVATPPEASVSEVARLMKERGVDAVPVLDMGRLVGVVANLDMARLPEDKWPNTAARDIMSKQLVFAHPDDTLYDAMEQMNIHHISHLPIVDEADPGRLVGFLAIHDISHTYSLSKKTISTNSHG